MCTFCSIIRTHYWPILTITILSALYMDRHPWLMFFIDTWAGLF